MSNKAIPLFCYRDAKHYEEMRSVFTDAHTLPATFEAWQSYTETNIQLIQHQGVIVNRIYPESADEFISCCRDFEWNVDEEGRIYYAFLKARQ